MVTMLNAVELKSADLLHHYVQARHEDNCPRFCRTFLDIKRLTPVADDHVIKRISSDTQERIDAHIVVYAAVGERDIFQRSPRRIDVWIQTKRREDWGERGGCGNRTAYQKV